MATATASGSGGGNDPPPPKKPSRLPALWTGDSTPDGLVNWLRHVLLQIAANDRGFKRFLVFEKTLQNLGHRLVFYVAECIRHARRSFGQAFSSTAPVELDVPALRNALIAVAGWRPGSSAFQRVREAPTVRSGPPQPARNLCSVLQAATLPYWPHPTPDLSALPTELPSTVRAPTNHSLLERSVRTCPRPGYEPRGVQFRRSGCLKRTTELDLAFVRRLFTQLNCTTAAGDNETVPWLRAVVQFLAYRFMTEFNNFRAVHSLSDFTALDADSIQVFVDGLPSDLETIVRLAEVPQPELGPRAIAGRPFQPALVVVSSAEEDAATASDTAAQPRPEEDSDDEEDDSSPADEPARKRRR